MGTRRASDLATWAARVEDQERSCPWPGPRPLDPADLDPADPRKGRNLIGRDADVKRLCQRLESDYLLILHGESGVGKSSFLQIGLTRGLTGANFQAYALTEWPQWVPAFAMTDGTNEDLFAQYLRDRFVAQFGHRMSKVRMAEMEQLGVAEFVSRFPGRPVLVLDQFEEFLRVTGWDGLEWFSRWLVEVNLDAKLRVVISLRSEYLYKIDPILKKVRQFSLSYQALEPITAREDIEKIIANPATWCSVNVDADVAFFLSSSFAESANIRDSFWLLQMQAVLYSLYWHCGGQPDHVRLSTDMFRSWLQERSIDPRRLGTLPAALANFMISGTIPEHLSRNEWTESARALAEMGFLHAVDLKLQHCEDIALSIETLHSDVMNPLARDHLRRALPYLSSGMYKERQHLLALFRSAFDDELTRLQNPGRGTTETDESSPLECGHAALTDEALNLLFESLWPLATSPAGDHNLLSVSRDLLVGSGGGQERCGDSDWIEAIRMERAHLQIDHVPWFEDENSVSSGPLLGARPIEVAAEMLRCFLYASLWLEKSLICRITDSQIRLAHDGFGPALRDWASTTKRPAEAEIASFVSLVGEFRDWTEAGAAFGADASEPETRYLINLRWQSCQLLGASFRRVVFLNCDFRNTRFEACRFEGVAFVNCLLDGSILSRCTVIGSASIGDMADAIPERDAAWTGSDEVEPRKEIERGSIPSFVVDGSVPTTPVVRHFRGVFALDHSWTTPSPQLIYSATSGVGAMVVERRPRGAGQVPAVCEGIVILGSRISGFMIRKTTFEDLEGMSLGSSDRCDDDPTGRYGLVLAYVAGSSIDLVEQDELSLGIVGCALRGLSISRPLTGADRPSLHAAFEVEVRDSLLVNTWFGDLLRGAVTISDSTVFGLASMAHYSDLSVTLAPTVRVAMVDNVSTLGCRTMSLGGVAGWSGEDGCGSRLWRSDDLEQVSRKTDYRDLGARYELEQRASRRLGHG